MNSNFLTRTNGFSVDYITFTFTRKEYSNIGAKRLTEFLNDVYDLSNGFLSLEKFDCSRRGINCYDLSARLGNGLIICTATDNANLGHSILVNISGTGLTEIGSDNLYRILIFCASSDKFNCTRCDIAFDDFNRVIPLKKINSAFNCFLSGKKNIDTRFTRENLNIYNGVYNEVKYTNYSFGSRGSSQFLRIYDKRAEQGVKNPSVALQLPEYWYRLEIECRKDVSNTVINRFIDGDELSDLFRFYLNRMLRFLDHSATDSELTHINRVSTADWWLAFIETDIKGFVLHKEIDSSDSIDDMFRHIENNYAAYLYVLRCVSPKRLEYIIDVVGRNKSADNPKYRRIVDCPHDLEF